MGFDAFGPATGTLVRKLLMIVVAVTCVWYARHVLLMVDSVLSHLAHFIH